MLFCPWSSMDGILLVLLSLVSYQRAITGRPCDQCNQPTSQGGTPPSQPWPHGLRVHLQSVCIEVHIRLALSEQRHCKTSLEHQTNDTDNEQKDSETTWRRVTTKKPDKVRGRMRIKHLYSPVWGSSLQVPPLQRAKETEILIVCTQRFHLPHRHKSESNPKTDGWFQSGCVVRRQPPLSFHFFSRSFTPRAAWTIRIRRPTPITLIKC